MLQLRASLQQKGRTAKGNTTPSRIAALISGASTSVRQMLWDLLKHAMHAVAQKKLSLHLALHFDVDVLHAANLRLGLICVRHRHLHSAPAARLQVEAFRFCFFDPPCVLWRPLALTAVPPGLLIYKLGRPGRATMGPGWI